MYTPETCPTHIFNTKTYVGQYLEIVMKACIICDHVEGESRTYFDDALEDMLNLNNEG